MKNHIISRIEKQRICQISNLIKNQAEILIQLTQKTSNINFTIQQIQQFKDKLNNSIQMLTEHKSQLLGQIQLISQQLQKKKILEGNLQDKDLIITPKKIRDSEHLLKNAGFGFTSQIKTKQDFDSIASTNDQFYRDFQQMMQKYQRQKQTLNHQNQIVLNQWSQSSHHNSSMIHPSSSEKNGFLELVRSLIHQLSKYQSVGEYINSIQLLQNEKAIRQLQQQTSSQNEDIQKKWLKQGTKKYLLKMAKLLRNQRSDANNYGESEELDQEDLQYIF